MPEPQELFYKEAATLMDRAMSYRHKIEKQLQVAVRVDLDLDLGGKSKTSTCTKQITATMTSEAKRAPTMTSVERLPSPSR